MKRLVFLVTSVFIFFACENDLEFDKATDSPSLQTKSASVIEDPIYQLMEQQIPINIILSSSGSNNAHYLSVPRKDVDVDLASRDDGSLRQRWLLVKPNTGIVFGPILQISGGVSNEKRIYLGGTGGDMTKLEAILLYLPGYELMFENIQGTGLYNIRTYKNMNIGSYPPGYGYLGAASTNSMDINWNVNNRNNGLGNWIIKPVGQFQVVDMEYVLENGDIASYIPEFVETRTYNNTSSVPVKITDSYTEEVTETSKFSSTESLTMTFTNSASVSFAVPSIDGQGNISTTNTSSQTWNYTQDLTQSRKRTMTKSYELTVPANMSIAVTSTITRYKLSATYVAHFKSVTTQKIIKLKGKWEGIQAQNFDLKIVDANTGQPVDVQLRAK